MNTEVQTRDSIAAATEVAEPFRRAATPGAGRQFWQRRGFQVSALVAVVVAGAALAANNLLARQYTPDATVRQYLSALQSADATTAWAQVQVAAPTASVAAALTDRAAFQAALGAGKPDMKDFSIITTTNLNASTASVDFNYDTSSGTKQGKFIVQRSGQTHFGLYPNWHVVLTPSLLQITLPKGANGVSIDGKAVAVAPGAQSTVAVLPLPHQVQFNGTEIMAPEALTVDASFSLGQSVAFQPQLTAAGLAVAKAAVLGAFAICAQQTSPNPDSGSCPQTIGHQLPGSGTWSVVGDPTQDMVVSFDKDMNAVATGHYQMVFAYQGGFHGTQHVPSSGAYGAALVLAPTDLSVAGISSVTGQAVLTRPAGATDQLAKDMVAQALKKCAAVRADSVADCPQAAPDLLITNVRWRLTADPIAAAIVSFDPTNGLFTVHGNFAMSVTYDFFGYPRTRQSYITAYDARLLWDGKTYQLVTIDGANS